MIFQVIFHKDLTTQTNTYNLAQVPFYAQNPFKLALRALSNANLWLGVTKPQWKKSFKVLSSLAQAHLRHTGYVSGLAHRARQFKGQCEAMATGPCIRVEVTPEVPVGTNNHTRSEWPWGNHNLISFLPPRDDECAPSQDVKVGGQKLQKEGDAYGYAGDGNDFRVRMRACKLLAHEKHTGVIGPWIIEKFGPTPTVG